jgi:biotin transporter BioY
MNGGLIAAILIIYALGVICLAIVRRNPMWLWGLFLPAAPFVIVGALVCLVMWIFGSAAGAAVKQETGWKADGTRAYPYHVRKG